MASWCRAADSPDRYLGYFENEHGEQAIFVYDRARRSGTLSLGDAGWEHSHAVVEGTVAGVALGAVEQAWLAACWKAATGARSPRVAVAYLRASKDEQRLSREAQRNAIEAWAMHEGVRVAAWCIDHGVRSVSPMAERPALRAALVALRQDNAGVFVVAKRNRIARDVVLAASITGAVALEGARVVSVSGEGNGDSPADAFIRTVIDGAAQYEHGLIRSRACSLSVANSVRVAARLPRGITRPWRAPARG